MVNQIGGPNLPLGIPSNKSGNSTFLNSCTDLPELTFPTGYDPLCGYCRQLSELYGPDDGELAFHISRNHEETDTDYLAETLVGNLSAETLQATFIVTPKDNTINTTTTD